MRISFAPKLALTLILVFFALSVKAQSICTAKLDSAIQLYNSGQIEEIPLLLDSCLNNGFTKEEKIQANLLLIQVYLFDSNREKAEQVMNRFLRDFPSYEIQPTDPAEFIELYRHFKVNPTWGLGVYGSANISQISVLQHFSTENLNNLNSTYTPNGLGFDAGFHINKYFKSKFWLSFDLQYSMVQFKRKDILGSKTEELNYSESTGWFSTPVYLNFVVKRGDFSPYLFAGGEFGYLFVDKSYILRKNLIDNTIPNVVQKSTSNISNREPYNIWGIGGIGLQLKAWDGYFNFSVGYKYCLLPFVKKETRYSNNNQLYYYQYIDDDFKINRLYCTFGFTKLFYKIKK